MNGYTYISLPGIDLQAAKVQEYTTTISGIYNRAKRACESGKPIYISDMMYNLAKVLPILAFVIYNSRVESINFRFQEFTITIESGDTVTVNVIS